MSKSDFAAVGWSANTNAFAAGQAAARIALKQLAHQRVQYVIVFAASWFDQAQLLAGVRSVFGDALIAGGSTAGEIAPMGPKTHSCVLLAVAYDDITVSLGIGLGVDRDPRLAGYQAAQQSVQQFNGKMRRGFLFFGDGLLTGYAEVLRGIQEVLGTSSLVTGGLMADDLRFTTTYQYANDQVLRRSIVGLLFGGACAIGVGVEHGFEPISKPRKVTKAQANILYELDGQPASSVYEEYFGPSVMASLRQEGLTRRLIAYPLGMQVAETSQLLLRNVMAFGEDGSMLCTGEVTEGSWVHVMIGSREPALEAASLAAWQAVKPLSSVRFVLVFDSAVRRRLLGRSAAEEIHRIRKVVGASVPMIGCYTYGEQTPLGQPYGYGRSSVQTGACLVIAVGPS